MERILCIVIGYVFGLFQTGYIYGRLNHVDIRDFGSGNAGTTNTMRVLGKKAGIITYFGDSLKAVFAIVLIYFIFRNTTDNMFILKMYTGLGVILGHNFPFYMKFRGGKGIAATSGVILGLGDWRLVLLAFFTFVIVTVVSKYVSLGSLCMAAGFFVEFVIFAVLKMLPLSGNSIVEGIVLAFIISTLAFIKHHANIQRLLNGTERKIGQSKNKKGGE